MTRLVVAYSHSAVLPRDLIGGLDWCSAVLFVTPGGDDARPVPPLLADLGEVLALADDGAIPWDELRAFGADGVVTFSEDLLERTATMAEGLGLPHATADTVAALRDKRLQRARLRAAGVEQVRTAALTSPADWPEAAVAVGFPMVLKPARGAGSVATRLATTEAEGREHVEASFAQCPDRPLVAEEYLVGMAGLPFGDYVSVESLVVEGRVLHLGVTGKLPLLPPFRETGQFHPAGLAPELEESVRALTSAAIAALGLTTGAVHTEVKLTPSGPRLIEVNGRLGGYVNELYGRVLDQDVIELVGRAACGLPVQVNRPVAQLHFQYTHQPPLGATRLLGLEGALTVARHPAVSRYERLVPVGASLPDDDSTHDLDLVCGSVADLADLDTVLRDVRSGLTFAFETSGGTVALTGPELDGR